MNEKILQHFRVPTGDIYTSNGDYGIVEFLSLGDYGKEINLALKPVPDGLPLMPLTEKWVITISTQYGCSMGCKFCDVPKVGPGRNVTLNDLQQQILIALHEHPEILYTKRLNIHYARMGEPTWNPNVLDHAKWLKEHINPEYRVHPVVSSMMPKNNIWLKTFIHNWMRIKNRLFDGNAGLQLSINSTCDTQREEIFNHNALSLWEIAKIMDGIVPFGRKITLNFPIAGWEISPNVLKRYFSPEYFICKLTPMHKTSTALSNNYKTVGDYTKPDAYLDYKKNLEKAEYQVLVFIASHEEDEGMITCGNSVITGKKPTLRS